MEAFIVSSSDLSQFENVSIQIDDEEVLKQSSSVFLISKRVNIIAALVVICTGLIGNSLTLFMFAQKKYRINSTHVYLFCLSINDSLFMIIHLFEDTIRTYSDLYLNEDENILIKLLNLVDHFEISCRLINYLRYSLRFMSTYILVSFTLQRLFLVYQPFSTNFKSKKSAWKTIEFLFFISFVINLWVPFFFQIHSNNYNQSYCDIKTKLKSKYFKINVAYIGLVIFIPITIILICNLLMLLKLVRDDKKEKNLRIISTRSDLENLRLNRYNQKLATSNRDAPESTLNYLTFEQLLTRKQMKPKCSSKKITKMLGLLSTTFIILNLPYLVAWTIYFYEMVYRKNETNLSFYLFSILNITEILNLANYGIKFFIYCLAGYRFKNQIKYPTSRS